MQPNQKMTIYEGQLTRKEKINQPEWGIEGQNAVSKDAEESRNDIRMNSEAVFKHQVT
jgi:hypothetical protein